MIGVGLTAISICLLKYNPFLFTLGIFSTYMTITGYRSLQYYKGTKNPKVQRDWILLVITFLLAGGFTSHMIWTEGMHLMGIQLVLLVFMSILLSMLLGDIRVLLHINQLNKGMLLKRHIGRMGGAYISTLTAFLVTNVQTEPLFLAWLLPTAIGTPFIIYFIRKYAPKKKKARQTIKA